MIDTLKFTEELVRRVSVSPEDAGCQDLLIDQLEALDFRVEPMNFGDVRNFWARRGTAGPVFCFAGHTDVVPAGPLEQWQSPPFEPSLRDGVLYGRGTADMKASLAAMTNATAEFIHEHPQHRGSIAFLITSDEEGRARDGTRRVMEELDQRGETIDWCLIGEPSCEQQLGDTIRVGRRGSLSGILTVHGQQGHVAYPHLASNPIQRFAPVLAELCELKLDDGNQFFPTSSFQFVQLESGSGAPNVIPGELRARFNFRYSTVWTHEQLQSLIEELFDRHGLDYSLKWHLSGKPFLTPGGELVDSVAESVKAATGIQPELSTGGGTSDGRFIAPSGAHVVEFGAINRSIHKVNECIPVDHIAVLQQAYRGVLERMLG